MDVPVGKTWWSVNKACNIKNNGVSSIWDTNHSYSSLPRSWGTFLNSAKKKRNTYYTILLVEEIPNNQLGCIIQPCQMMGCYYHINLVTAGFLNHQYFLHICHHCFYQTSFHQRHGHGHLEAPHSAPWIVPGSMPEPHVAPGNRLRKIMGWPTTNLNCYRISEPSNSMSCDYSAISEPWNQEFTPLFFIKDFKSPKVEGLAIGWIRHGKEGGPAWLMAASNWGPSGTPVHPGEIMLGLPVYPPRMQASQRKVSNGL